MDFWNIFNFLDLNHVLTILGIIASVYGYIFIKASKFVVIKRVSENILTNAHDFDVKLNNIRVRANVYHYRCVIYYRGAHDIEKKDIYRPFIIYNPNEYCKWHNLKITRNSAGFKPIIKTKKNQILIITNEIFKTGDSIEIDFLLESNNKDIYFEHRILNVSSKQTVYRHDYKAYFGAFISTTFVSLFLFVFIYTQIQNYNYAIKNKPPYGIEYVYLGNEIARDNSRQYFKDIQIDSIYSEKLTDENTSAFKKDSITEKIDFYNTGGKFRFIHPIYNTIIEFDLPSKKAEALYKRLSKEKKLKYEYYYKIDNDLKIRFINTKKLNYSDWTLIILISIAIIGFIISFIASLDNLKRTILVKNAIRNLSE